MRPRVPFTFVIVSGPGGIRKSTHARALSLRQGMPVFWKDTIEEALTEALDLPELDPSRRFGAASVGQVT